jgi:hypothetical protein
MEILRECVTDASVTALNAACRDLHIELEKIVGVIPGWIAGASRYRIIYRVDVDAAYELDATLKTEVPHGRSTVENH